MTALPPSVAALSPQERRALLARLLQERSAGAEEVFPLSYGQQALWFLYQLAPHDPVYNVMNAWTIRSTLDASAFRGAWQALVDRHTALRTTYAVRDGQPCQEVHTHRDVDFAAMDASTWSAGRLQERVGEDAHAAFDLYRDPPLRVRLYSRSPDEHVVLLAMHHIATDVWSLVVLFDEFLTLYAARRTGRAASLPPLTGRYADFVRWQRELLAGPEGERLWRYWSEQLAGPRAQLRLPIAHQRPAVHGHRGAAHQLQLDRALTDRLQWLAAAEGTTPYVVLLAGFQALLHRYSGEDDVLVGSMTAGRSRPEFAGTIGYFANPVALRVDLAGVAGFRELVGQARAAVLGALAHQDYPFARLVDRLQVERDLSRSPLFDAMFVLQKTHRARSDQAVVASDEEAATPFALAPREGSALRASFGTGVVEPFPLRERCARFDLDLQLIEMGGWITGALHYNADLFAHETIERFADHYRTLLEAVAAEPDRRLTEVPLLGPAERRRVLVDWNATTAALPPACLHHLVEAQARRSPDATALLFEHRRLTYRELDERANSLARRLRQRGAGPEALVGVYLERSPELIVGLLAVLKAGGAYVPLDPTYPEERLAFMLEDAGAPLLLTQRSLLGRLPARGAAVVCVDDPEAAGDPATAPGDPGVRPEHLAYVLYTSGSTGRPKGVMVSHANLVNVLQALCREPGLAPTERDCWLAVTPIGFDIAGLELFLPLSVGARVALASATSARDGERLRRELAETGATVLQATPATWRLLLAAGLPRQAGLRLLCGGEALPPDLAAELLHRGAGLWNLYGPTETTIWSTAHDVGADASPTGVVAIGRPIANTQVFVLDARLEPVPPGAPGELCIGGAGVARGYLGRPELTAERFVPDPFGAPGGRLYRTGDLARHRPDGALEFLGRADDQVKIRGHRVEPGEIEAALRRHDAVGQVVVVVREDATGDQRLVAYLVPRPGAAVTPEELRRFLQGKLPAHMLPTAFVALAGLPLLPNGKIDRRALPPPDQAAVPGAAAYVAPRTALEQTIAAVWQEVLGIERVGRHDNFFDVGGHSLLLLRVHAELRETLWREFPLLELFNHPTVHGLASYLSQKPSAEQDTRRDDDRRRKIAAGRVRLSQLQLRRQGMAVPR